MKSNYSIIQSVDKISIYMLFFHRGITLTVGGYNLALSNGGVAYGISCNACYYYNTRNRLHNCNKKEITALSLQRRRLNLLTKS